LATAAVEQGEAHGTFQLLDLHGYGGLGQMQLLRCAGEAQVARRTGEDLQLSDCHAFHKLLLIHDVTISDFT
jgi:hypothetical protein